MTPRYNPWDQRLCLVPNGDLFKAVRAGKASIATDEIERFTETGVRLRSGQHLDADLVIAATGLKLQMLGGSVISVDGRPISLGDTVSYKGIDYPAQAGASQAMEVPSELPARSCVAQVRRLERRCHAIRATSHNNSQAQP